MSDYIRHEFFIRPIMLHDPSLEDVIIRRDSEGHTDANGNPAPRLLEGYTLQDNTVLGKQNGLVVALPYIWLTKAVTIDPDQTEIVGVAPASERSRQWKFDVDSQEEYQKSSTFMTLARVMPDDTVVFTKFARIGDKIKHTLSASIENNDIVIRMTNRHTATIEVNSLIVG